VRQPTFAAASLPNVFLPDLARSLNNLGNRLGELGRREEALAAARDATDVCRRLAAERPDAFSPFLAGSLDNLGNRLSELGRREEALAATHAAVDIRQRLAGERPDTFRPFLAVSLDNLSIRLSNLGRREEALTAVREAVTLLAPFFLRLPMAHIQTMRVIYKQYLELSKKNGIEPDAALLTPIVEAFQKLQGPPDTGPSNDA
jgi:tetratricopeptide (TPR) repeat protein